MSYAGTILRVDLTTGTMKREPTSRYTGDYIGDAGIAAKIFWEEVPPETRPFDPANLLMFNTGPLTGTLLGNKATISSKTPVRANNPFAFVGMGGQFPSEMKFAGYDHIIIRGKAEKPSYLLIDNDRIEIRGRCPPLGSRRPRNAAKDQGGSGGSGRPGRLHRSGRRGPRGLRDDRP